MDVHRISIEFTPQLDLMLSKLKLDPDSDEAEDFAALVEQLRPLAKPKAALLPVRVDSVRENGAVRLGGVDFTSTILAKNLKEVEIAWGYLATCGRELYDYVQAMPDPFERFWGEEVMQQALTDVRAAQLDYLGKNLYSGKTAAMGPGSLPDWPISQQEPLFNLLSEAVDYCGVTLTDTMLILPNKSVSGVFFPNEEGYVNCRLCPKERCPNRRAAYDPALAH